MLEKSSEQNCQLLYKAEYCKYTQRVIRDNHMQYVPDMLLVHDDVIILENSQTVPSKCQRLSDGRIFEAGSAYEASKNGFFAEN